MLPLPAPYSSDFTREGERHAEQVAGEREKAAVVCKRGRSCAGSIGNVCKSIEMTAGNCSMSRFLYPTTDCA